MKTRKEKISWLKTIISGKANQLPAKCDIIAFYPELKKPYYLFVNGKEATPDEYKEAFEKNKALTDKNSGGRFYFGTGSGNVVPDPLPDYFDVKAETA